MSEKAFDIDCEEMTKMEDSRIVELYWRRSGDAIAETSRKYGGYCYAIAYNLLSSVQDAEECVNDTWLGAWNSMPDNRPNYLAPFLGKIARSLAFNRFRAGRAEKRGGGELPLVLEELGDCVPAAPSAAQAVEDGELELLASPEERELIRRLGRLPQELIDTVRDYDPARLTRYVYDVATLFHKFYNTCRVKGEADNLQQARLALCTATRTVIANVLGILKISAPEVM